MSMTFFMYSTISSHLSVYSLNRAIQVHSSLLSPISMFIIIFLIALSDTKAVNKLTITANLVCKQLLLKGEAKCEQLQADRVVTQELEITTTFSSDILQLDSISPFRTGKAALLLELEPTITFSGNTEFADGIYRDDDDESTTQQTIQPEFIQIHGQSQWVPVVLHTFEQDEQYWRIAKKTEVHDDKKLRAILRQNEFNYNHESFKRSQLDVYDFDFQGQMIAAKHSQTLIFQYNKLPPSHTYIRIQANFHMLTELWRPSTKLWLKADGELVWMQNHSHTSKGLCSYMQHVLNKLQHGIDLQAEISNMYNHYWTNPIDVAVKHIRHKIHLEFGITLGKPQCIQEYRLLFQELENRFQLFAIDDFLLEYK